MMVTMGQPTCRTAMRETMGGKPVMAVRVSGRKMWDEVSSLVYLPAFVVPGVALLLVGAGWATRWGGADFAGSLTSLRVATIGPVALAMIVLCLVAERVRPAQRRPLIARGHRHDVLWTVLNVIVALPLVTALTLSLADVVRAVAPWVVLPRLGLLPHWVAIVLILVAMDGFNWMVHLANHRVRLLWRFHEVHHSQEDMNVLTVFRTHPFIHVSYVLAVVPALVLIANGELPTLLLAVYGGAVAFAHSNTDLSFGPLGRVFVSPNYHRIHHRLRGPQDVNLGFTLTIWDQVFDRAVFPTPDTIGADTGLPHRPLRVEQQGPRPRHITVLAGQLLGPFRPLNDPLRLASVREHTAAGDTRWGQSNDEAAAPIRPRDPTPKPRTSASEPVSSGSRP
jgi:sterol desaturase/sphingolipid hydroxylase (fatty acid hydroxylase superfamily)